MVSLAWVKDSGLLDCKHCRIETQSDQLPQDRYCLFRIVSVYPQ